MPLLLPTYNGIVPIPNLQYNGEPRLLMCSIITAIIYYITITVRFHYSDAEWWWYSYYGALLMLLWYLMQCHTDDYFICYTPQMCQRWYIPHFRYLMIRPIPHWWYLIRVMTVVNKWLFYWWWWYYSGGWWRWWWWCWHLMCVGDIMMMSW